MNTRLTSLAVLGLAASFAAGQSASVTVSASASSVAPGGSFTVSLQTSFDTAGAGGGLFGAAGFYGFGGSVTGSGDPAPSLTGGVPTLNGQLAFGPVAAGGAGATLATGGAGRGLSGGIAGDPGDLMTFTVDVAGDAAAGDVTLDFDGAVVLVLDNALVTFSTNPGPNQQSLTTTSVTVTVGAGGCNDADLAEPFGILDLNDISAFVSAFTTQQPAGDIDGNGIFDLTDISLFVGAFTAGCP
jgi:hypothetical protein